jgi:hypothetical protein
MRVGEFRARSWPYIALLAALVTYLNPMGAFGQGVARPMPTSPGVVGNQNALPAKLRMRVENGQVTAEIGSTPLQAVLEELAARTGVVFEVQAQDNPAVSIHLYRVPLEEAIRRLGGTNNSIFFYDAKAATPSQITLVRLFPRSGMPQQPSLRYLGTGAVTKTGDDSIDTPEQAMKALSEGANLEVRQKAVEILVAAKGDASIQALIKALGDPAPEVKVAVIEGLAGLEVRPALPEILLALKDTHPGVRQSAITAVALLGDADNIKNLKVLAKDSDLSVAAAAEMAIRKLSARRP